MSDTWLQLVGISPLELENLWDLPLPSGEIILPFSQVAERWQPRSRVPHLIKGQIFGHRPGAAGWIKIQLRVLKNLYQGAPGAPPAQAELSHQHLTLHFALAASPKGRQNGIHFRAVGCFA